MAPGMAYDDGGLASYFGVTFLAILLVPGTYLALKPSKTGTSIPHKHHTQLIQPDNLKSLCGCAECQANAARLRKLKAGTFTRRLVRRLLPLALAWALFAYLSYGIWTTPQAPGQTIYNPFEILGLESSSNEKQIKKHYKKLSLQLYVAGGLVPG
jgi:translocation protein SEC63